MCQSVHELARVQKHRVCNVLVPKTHGVTQTFSLSGFDVTIVYLVVLRGCVQVPPVDIVTCPHPLHVSFLMYLYLAAHRGEWHFVVVEGAELTIVETVV